MYVPYQKQVYIDTMQTKNQICLRAQCKLQYATKQTANSLIILKCLSLLFFFTNIDLNELQIMADASKSVFWQTSLQTSEHPTTKLMTLSCSLGILEIHQLQVPFGSLLNVVRQFHEFTNNKMLFWCLCRWVLCTTAMDQLVNIKVSE